MERQLPKTCGAASGEKKLVGLQTMRGKSAVLSILMKLRDALLRGLDAGGNESSSRTVRVNPVRSEMVKLPSNGRQQAGGVPWRRI